MIGAKAHHRLGILPEDNSDRAVRVHNRIVLAEAVGYYGLLGVAAVSAFLLH